MLDAGCDLLGIAPLTILIVDDSPEDREAVQIYLSEAGFGEGLDIAYVEASSGEAGLAAYRAEPPDCILLDYYLPDMLGLDFLSRLKEEADDIPLPIVMLTGATDRMLASAALRAGAQEYLSKQLMGPEMLLRAVQSSRHRFDLIVERRQSHAALGANEQLLRLSQEAGGIASFECDYRTSRIRWAAGSQTQLGFATAQNVMSVTDWLAMFHPSDAVRIVEERNAAVAAHLSRATFHGRLRRPDTGALRQLECRVGFDYDTKGEVRSGNVAVLDVTEQRAATEKLSGLNDELDQRVREHTAALLQEGRRRTETEAMLHQAQKMEAIGQLTGGIAHDFNNLLHAITGNVELAQRRIERMAATEARPSGDALTALRKSVEAALKAGHSAAEMIRRLLAFARRQTLETVELDASSLVSGMSDMIQRALGTRIQVDMALDADPLLALADANQLEAAILNLVVNARDAMPAGGRLTITTAAASLNEVDALQLGDIVAGDYVMVHVSDTGTGIPHDVIGRVFEPFFTTKEVGRGTGLGLAMVYGFIKQSHGGIRIASEVGKGTSVTMYLPRSTGKPITIGAFRGGC